MSNFINYSFAQAAHHPELTTVVGDIERWAELYLDTGQHLQEWNEKIEAMWKKFADENSRIEASHMLSSVLG